MWTEQRFNTTQLAALTQYFKSPPPMAGIQTNCLKSSRARTGRLSIRTVPIPAKYATAKTATCLKCSGNKATTASTNIN